MTTEAPRRPGLLQRSALGLLRLFGWRSSFVWPPEPKGLIVVYPHTSNWDFVIGLLFRIGNGLPANWVGKAEMFPAPFLRLLTALGGIPVDRRRSAGFVRALLEEFRRRDWMWLAIAPEGTRSRTDHLKSGFYQLALTGGLPVALGYIDYGSKTVGVDTYVRFSGDLDADLERLRTFYADKRAHRPERAGDLRLRDHATAPADFRDSSPPPSAR